MINNVRDLQSWLLRKADLETNPIFKRPHLLLSPGADSERIDWLHNRFKKFPRSYSNFISMFTLNGVIIDDFELSPFSFKSKDTVSGILEAYDAPFFPKEFMQKHNLYQIGSYNTDILCVTEGTDQFKEGEILYIDEGYDIYNPQDTQIRRIAKDFEQFLIVAGNLDEIHDEMQGDESDYEQKREEFIKRLQLLNVDKKYYNAWLNVF